MCIGKRIISSMSQEKQIQDLIRHLNKLAHDLELLIDRTKSGGVGPVTGNTGSRNGSGNSETDEQRGSAEREFSRHKMLKSPVRLNVGGEVFPVTWKMMMQIPNSRLAKLAASNSLEEALKVCDGYNPNRNELYFNRRSKSFSDIVEFYRMGSLHVSEDSCVMGFVQDLEYWKIPLRSLEACCLKRFTDLRDQLEWDAGGTPAPRETEVFPPGRKGRVMKRLWDLFEKPHTSLGARVIGIISLACIILSTVILTLNSLPYFQAQTRKIIGDYWVFAIIEMLYMSWFTLEFIIRLFSCPDKLIFFKKAMNWIDLLAIVPYYITISMYVVQISADSVATKADNASDVRRIAQFIRLLRIVKTLRIIRIFKLARHSTGLQALGHTIKSNYKELGLLILFLGMGAIMFSSLVYVFENDIEATSFGTMLDAYWWAIITMTTVGFGDVVPTTFMGKVIGCLCAVFGVLVIGLPIPIIGTSFNNFYAREKRREKAMIENLDLNFQGAPLPRPNDTVSTAMTSFKHNGAVIPVSK